MVGQTHCWSIGTDDTRYCLKLSNGNTITSYTYTPTSDYKYKLVLTKDTTSYYITGSNSPTVGGKNLLTDESTSFEGGTVGIWTTNVGLSTIVADGGFHGTKEIRATLTGAAYSLSSFITSLVSANTYTLSTWVKAGNPGAIGVVVANILKGNISGWTTGSTATLTTEWQRISMTKTFTEEDTAMTAYPIYYVSGHAAGDIICVDGIQLELGMTATPSL